MQSIDDFPNKVNIPSEGIMSLFYQDLPPKPYCTNDLIWGLRIRPKERAIQDAYVQHNKITRADWIVLDLDYRVPGVHFWPDEAVPCPNFEVQNPDNGHAHLFFKIDPAVYTLRQARQAPLRLAAAVERGLTRLFGADPGYSGLISKNPLHSRWNRWEWHYSPLDLLKVLDSLPEKYTRAPRKKREIVGLGRNCTLFDDVRYYAYRAWRMQGYKGEVQFYETVRDRAQDVNAEFGLPLGWNEVHGIVKSIVKWTVNHMDAAGMSRWASRRGKIGGKKSTATRRDKAANRAAQVKAFKAAHPSATIRELAITFGTSEMTIKNYLQV